MKQKKKQLLILAISLLLGFTHWANAEMSTVKIAKCTPSHDGDAMGMKSALLTHVFMNSASFYQVALIDSEMRPIILTTHHQNEDDSIYFEKKGKDQGSQKSFELDSSHHFARFVSTAVFKKSTQEFICKPFK